MVSLLAAKILSTMKRFIARVKEIYKTSHEKIPLWPPRHSNTLIRSKLVMNENMFTNLQQEGKVVPYRDIFKADGETKKPIRIVLIHGSAGISKTMLSVLICKDWANGKIFQQFKLILLLPLHHKRVKSASSIHDLLKLQCSNEDEEVYASVARHLEQEKGKNILVIADGWDKLGKCEVHELNKLIFGPNYPDLSVIITSRSSACSNLKCIDRFIALRGFSRENIKEFIQLEFIGHEEQVKAAQLLAQVEANQLVETTCIIPSNCALICRYLHSFEESTFPTTMTEFYSNIILSIISYNTQQEKDSLSLFNFESMPEDLQQTWLLLCELAFQGIVDNQVTFSQEDLTERFTRDFSMKTVPSFGLMRPSYSAFGIDMDTFSFLHLTFQEYLAAVHLVNQPPDRQLKFLKLHAKSIHHYIVWRFVFGIFASKNEEQDVIKQVIEILCQCRPNEFLEFCHYAFEAKNEAVNYEVVHTLPCSRAVASPSDLPCKVFGDPHNAYDCDAIMHVMAHVCEACSIAINFRNCQLREKQVQRLGSVLHSKTETIGLQVKALDLSNNRLTNKVVSELFSKASASFQSLEKLFLRKNCIGREGITTVMAVLTRSPRHSVVQLDLSFNPLTISGLKVLQDTVCCGILEKLELLFMQETFPKSASDNIQFLADFVKALSSKCLLLRRVDLSDNDLGEPKTPRLSEIIADFGSFGKDFDLRLNREYMLEVDINFIAIMEESMAKKGTIDHTIAHGVFVGPGRSGKNSLMNRLIGEGPPDPDTISPSTGVLETVVKVDVKKLCTVATAVNNLVWKRLDYDEEALELMMTTSKNHSLSVDDSITSGFNGQTAYISSADDPTLSMTSALQSQANKKMKYYVTKKIHKPVSEHIFTSDISAAVVHSSDLSTLDRPLDVFKRAVELRRMDALREHLESSWSLYLTNTGGQMEFQELLPLLVCGPSIFFVTFPLNKNLFEYYTVQYQNSDGSLKAYESPSTLMDEILQTLATIAALDCTGLQQRHNVKPKIFIVGTHKDKISSEIIQERDKQLQERIKQTSLFLQGSIEFAIPTKQLIFTVNNHDKNDEDFKKIRIALQQSVERAGEFTVTCPSNWLIFSLILRAKHAASQVLSYEDCFIIAHDCGISDRTEFNNALHFIHTRLGLVRYFNVEGLNKVVIIDPQIIFDKITSLLVETIIPDHAKSNEIEEFKKRGVFSMEVMERIHKKGCFDTQLPLKWLLGVLNHLRVSVFFKDCKGEKKCFFPAALCHAPKNLLQQSCVFDIPPLLVAFASGFCPRGIPGALITCLMTTESKFSWKLHPSRIYRNQVSFSVGPGDVIIEFLPTHIKICYDPESELSDYSEVVITCGEAYKQIRRAVKTVVKGYRACAYFFCLLLYKKWMQN